MRENLKNARKEKNMTQQAVADYLESNKVSFKMRYGGSLIVCSNGNIYKRYSNGLYGMMKTNLSPSSRYLYVSVIIDGKVKHLLSHRLVAETFLENKDNLPTVNHIDGNRENNSVENLEWCSQADNVCHMVNMHKQRYLTNLKRIRKEIGIPQTKLPRKIGLKIGAYRDIENAVRPPNEEEKEKLEKYFDDSIENLLVKVQEGTI